MPGPKYVSDFSFPSDFGFSGSAGQTMVRSHERQAPRRFAEGGQVKAPVPPSPPKTPTPPPQPDKKVSLVDLLKGKGRKQQEAELGLKKGGKVKRAMGGPVKAAKGGCAGDVRKGIDKHVRAPKPRGHGVK